MYTCRICGKEYENIEDVMNCEKRDYEKKQKEEKNKQLEKLKQEKETRYAEVKNAFNEADKAYNKAKELENKYIKDYSMSFSNDVMGDDFINKVANVISKCFD